MAGDFHGIRFGGAESVAELMGRVAAALADVSREGEALWITHSGVIRAARLQLRGITRVDDPLQWPHEGLPFGGWLAPRARSLAMR